MKAYTIGKLVLPRTPFLKYLYNNSSFSTSALMSNQRSYKFVIVGGGTGGITMAARILSYGEKSVAVIEHSDIHFYQPYWTMVGGMLKNVRNSGRPMKDVIPHNAEWIQDNAVAFDPSSNLVLTQNGVKIKYEFLIVAVGIKLAFEKIKGLPEAFKTKGVCSNYSIHTVIKTVEAIKDFKEGNAIFTQPPNPIKCAGAPQKIMYLTESIFKKYGKKKNSNFIFNTALGAIFSVPKYAAALRDIAEDRGITVNYFHNLIEVKSDSREAIFQKSDSKGTPIGTEIYKYEMLHVTPPMEAHSVIKHSPLADSTGFVDVDKYTLQHKKYKNVFAIGDCSNLPTSKTAAAIAEQCGVLSWNIMFAAAGQELTEKYNGYTSCPLLTGNYKAILAEFDYDLQPLETLPFNQAKESSISYFLKANVMPTIYWNYMLKGKWRGPRIIRKILHLGFK